MGSIHLIMGCMFSGKSTELIRKCERYKTIGKKVLYINSCKDTRSKAAYGTFKNLQLGHITSHTNNSVQCVTCENIENVFHVIQDFDVFAIDEAQFFDDILNVVLLANEHDKIVIVSGLNGDYKQNVFGNMYKLIPHCDTLVKLHALCKMCNDGTFANFSHRIVENDNQKCIGGCNEYIPICRKHLVELKK